MASSNRRSWTCPARRKAMEPAATGPTSSALISWCSTSRIGPPVPTIRISSRRSRFSAKTGPWRRFKPIPLARARGIGLNLRQGPVFAENRERLEEILIVGTGGPIREVLHHEIRAEEVGPVAAGSIALRRAGQVQLRRLEEAMFDFESSVKSGLPVFPYEAAEEVRPHAGVQILAHFERDLDFFREWRRHVFGYLILRRIETRIGRKISDGCWAILDLNTRS